MCIYTYIANAWGMFMCLYVCMYVCMYTYMQMGRSARCDTFLSPQCTCILYMPCIYIRMYVHMYVYTYVCVCMYVCIYMCVCMYQGSPSPQRTIRRESGSCCALRAGMGVRRCTFLSSIQVSVDRHGHRVSWTTFVAMIRLKRWFVHMLFLSSIQVPVHSREHRVRWTTLDVRITSD